MIHILKKLKKMIKLFLFKGERLSCNVCGETFQTSRNLRKHEKVHEEAKMMHPPEAKMIHPLDAKMMHPQEAKLMHPLDAKMMHPQEAKILKMESTKHEFRF